MKSFKIFVIAAGLAFSIVFANPLSYSCKEEIMDLLEDYDLDMKAVMEDLVPVAVKVKAQAKAPLQFLFGPGPDNKMTSIGVSVGCLKEFPESANAIAPMLKSLGMELAKSKVTSKSGAAKKGGGGASSEQQSSQRNGAVKTKNAKTKDIIYMLNGQEIRDVTVTEIAIDEVKYKVGTRTVVYVLRKTEVSDILYANGEKDFFCNGISYNLATHFCHTDNQTYSCGNKPYDPSTQSCLDNVIYRKCGDEFHNIATHFCFDNTTYEKCGNKLYNPSTQSCSDNVIYEKCVNDRYNSETHLCE